MTKSVYVGFKFSQMGRHSGYDMVRFHAGYWKIIDCQEQWLFRFVNSQSLASKIYRYIFARRFWWVEFQCLWLALLHRRLVFHFVYAENIYRYLGWFKWLGFRIVCTYHQPHDFFSRSPRRLRGIRAVDHIIVLSREEIPYFQALKGDDRVHFVPHGIDVDFFCPSDDEPQRRELLLVGNWLRDFQFAAAVFDDLLARCGDLEIHVVALKINHVHFTPHPRLHLHCNVSDEDLVLRYRRAKLLFLPLQAFVANNAVLEASACGCPILIATDQQDRDEYLRWLEFVPLDKELAASKIIQRLDANDYDGAVARELLVQTYGWPRIGAIIGDILRSQP